MKLSALTLTFLLLLGCSQAPKELMSDLNIDFPQTEELTEISRQDSFELYNMVNFIVKDSLVMLVEYGFEHNCRCLNINTGKEISKFLYKGRAKNEMIDVFNMEFYEKDSIIVSGGYMGITRTYNLNDLLQQKNDSRLSELTAPESIVQGLAFIKIKGSQIVGTAGINDELNKYYVTENGQPVFIGKHNKDLFVSNKDITPNEINSTWMPHFIAHPSKEKVVAVNGFGILIEVIDLENKNISHSKYYEKVKCHFTDAGNEIFQMSWSNKTIIAKIGCDENKIYVITNETIMSPNDEIWHNYQLLTFDWNLNPIKRYVIPSSKMAFFHIPQQGDCLYALSTNNHDYYSLTKYKIN